MAKRSGIPECSLTTRSRSGKLAFPVLKVVLVAPSALGSQEGLLWLTIFCVNEELLRAPWRLQTSYCLSGAPTSLIRRRIWRCTRFPCPKLHLRHYRNLEAAYLDLWSRLSTLDFQVQRYVGQISITKDSSQSRPVEVSAFLQVAFSQSVSQRRAEDITRSCRPLRFWNMHLHIIGSCEYPKDYHPQQYVPSSQEPKDIKQRASMTCKWLRTLWLSS